jgi:hypothetical protein
VEADYALINACHYLTPCKEAAVAAETYRVRVVVVLWTDTLGAVEGSSFLITCTH